MTFFTAKCSNGTPQNDFRDHLSTFRTENTTKRRPFKAESNARTFPKQLYNNFEKVEETIFLKYPKHGCQLGKKAFLIYGYNIA